MSTGPWGETLQAGFPTEADTHYGRAFPYAERGVVLKVHTRDAPTNFSKSFVECDVLLVQLMYPLKNVPVVQTGYGVNGVEWVPVAPTKPLNIDKPTELAQAIRDTDADFVIVDFLGGREPVIRGQLPRPRAGAAIDLAGYSAAAADVAAGKGRVKGRVGGTTWEVDKDGNVVITGASGKHVTVIVAGSGEVRLGDSTGLQPAVLGDTLENRLDSLEATFNAHTHLMPGLGASAAASPSNPPIVPPLPTGVPSATASGADVRAARVKVK